MATLDQVRRRGRRRARAAQDPLVRPRQRDRHGRGLRSVLVPPEVPLYRTRTQRFDDLVLDAVEHLEHRWRRELAGIDFAVEDVPPTDVADWEPDVLTDGSVALARVLRPPPDGSESSPAAPGVQRPRVVIYRRPLELRAADPHELSHLVHDVVVEQVAHVLGIEPGEVESTGH